MSEQIEQVNPPSLEICLEALLFVAPEPVAISQLAEALERKPQEVEQALKNLAADYETGRGLRIQWYNGRVELTTAPNLASLIERYLGLEATARLSRAGLETLAIVAYRQPVTRPGIDSIRGVNSDGVLKSLLNKGLVQEMGRTEGPGRPILYGITGTFLQHFGLSSIEELPAFEVQEEDGAAEDTRLLKD
jgi:segregation and condensation protein B